MQRIVLFLCLCVAVEGRIGKHVYMKKMKTWTEAQSVCQQTYTDLTYFNSQREINEFLRFTFGNGFPAWIGLLRHNITAWKWSGGAHITHKNWHDEEPDNSGHSGYIEWDGKWYDVNPTKPNYFYCMDVSVKMTPMSWEEALNHCRQREAVLPSMLSETDFMMAETQMTKSSTERVWIGLRFLGDRWMWVNGDPLDYEAWSDGQNHQCPVRKRCGALNVQGWWENLDCEEELRFICA